MAKAKRFAGIMIIGLIMIAGFLSCAYADAGDFIPLELGEVYEGCFDQSQGTYYDQEIEFEFTALNDGELIIQGTREVELYLYNSNGGQIQKESYWGCIKFFAKANKNYHLKVKNKYPLNSTSFTLNVFKLTDDYGNSLDKASMIEEGKIINGKIEYMYDEDYFEFVAESSGTYIIESLGENDVYGTLYLQGSYFMNSDNHGQGNNFYMKASLEKGVKYQIKVTEGRNWRLPGDYQIKVTSVQDDFIGSNSPQISLNETIQGEINYKLDVDTFRFMPSQEGVYEIQVLGDPGMEIYCGDGAGSNHIAFGKVWLKPEVNYYIHISCGSMYDQDTDGRGVGGYTLTVLKAEDDTNKSFETAAQISVGQEVYGTSDYVLDTDYFRFSPETTGAYIIEGLKGLYLEAQVYDASGNIVCESIKNYQNGDIWIADWLEEKEEYYLEVFDYGIDEMYRFKVEHLKDDVGNYLVYSTELRAGESFAGEIEYPMDVDVYRFCPEKRTEYIFETTGYTDTYGELVNSQGETLVSNSGVNGKWNLFIPIVLEEGQIYYLKVYHQEHTDKDHAGTGKYTVTIIDTQDKGSDFESAFLIEESIEVREKIFYSGDQDYYQFVPQKTGMYTIDSIGDDKIRGAIYDGNKRFIKECNGTEGIGDNFSITQKLNAGEVYYIKVTNSNDFGSEKEYGFEYGLIVNYAKDDCIDSIAIGDGTYEGSIDYELDIDTYVFTAPQEGVYFLELGNDMLESTLKIYKDKEWYNYSSKGSVRYLKQGEVCRLDVQNGYLDKDYAKVGKYSFSIKFVEDESSNEAESAVEIPVGESIDGVIASPEDVDWFKIQVDVGGIYRIIELGGKYGITYSTKNAKFYVYENSIKTIPKEVNGKIFLLPNTTYYVKIYRGFSPYNTFAYHFELILNEADDYSDFIDTAHELTVEERVYGSIISDEDTDWFQWNITKSGHYRLSPPPYSNGLAYSMWIDGGYYGERLISHNSEIEELFVKEGSVLAIKVYSYDKDKYFPRNYHFGIYLGIEDDYNNDYINVDKLNINDSIKGKINYKGDIDCFRFVPEVTGMYCLLIETQASVQVNVNEDIPQRSNGNRGGWYLFQAGRFYNISVESSQESGEYMLSITKDTIPPTAPEGLGYRFVSEQCVELFWNPSEDNVMVEGYEVYRNGEQIARVGSCTYQIDSSWTDPNTIDTYSIRAVDKTGNYSAMSGEVQVVFDAKHCVVYGNIALDANQSTQPINQQCLSGFQIEVPALGWGGTSGMEGHPAGYFAIHGFANPESLEEAQRIKISKEGYLTRYIDSTKMGASVMIGSNQDKVVMWAGDVNGDGAINMTDIMGMIKHFNSAYGDGRYNSLVDYDGNGAVNMTDIQMVIRHFNKTSSDYPEVSILTT